MSLKNNLKMSHEFMSDVINEKSITIDATAGNGNDTLFLAKICKKVYAFDIQQQAVDSCSLLLKKNNIENVQLVLDGHEHLDNYVTEEVDGVMFNLGYLPTCNHSIATNYKTTIMGIEKSMNLLKKGGLITIVVYHGGDSGYEEKEEILEYVSKIDDEKYKVLRLSYENQRNNPPILLVIEKK